MITVGSDRRIMHPATLTFLIFGRSNFNLETGYGLTFKAGLKILNRNDF